MDGTVIVFYNPSEDEINDLTNKLFLTDYAVIIDNSKDNYQKLIENNLGISEKIIYKSFPENIGLCKALNIGIGILAERGCEWAFLLDSDGKIDKNILEYYKKYIANNLTEDVAVLAPVHIFSRSKNESFNGYAEVKRSMTSGWYLNISAFNLLGGFFESLFVDGLDFDFCYRARRRQYKIIQSGNSIVYHNPGHCKKVSILGKKIEIGQDSPHRYYMAARGEWWNFLMNNSIYDGLFFWYRVAKVIFFFENKKVYLQQMFKGAKEGFNLYKNINKREKTK